MNILQGLLGISVFILIAWALSENRKKVAWKLAGIAIAFQLLIALLLIYVPVISDSLLYLNRFVLALDQATKDGTSFIFGYLGGGATPFQVANPANNFIIAFQVLPIIIVVSAISALLFHWGILQKIIHLFSLALTKTLKVDGATGLGVASSIFLGIIESPLFVKPYLAKMSRSGLFALITAGMSTVAGTVMVLYSSVLKGVIDNPAGQILIASVMSAPAAILFAQLIIPPDSKSKTPAKIELKAKTKSAFEALINGTTEGVQMVIGVTGILIVLFALISLINMTLGWIPTSQTLTIQQLVGYLFIPLVWLMGIPSTEVLAAGQLMGTKLMLNEFVAYTQLGAAPLSTSSKLILTYALCGFANFGSLGILVGGLGTIVPDRKNEIVELSLKALIAGTLATMTTGTIIGLIH